MKDREKLWFAWAAVGFVLLIAFASSTDICRATYLKYGLEMQTCTDGNIRQTADLHVSNLRRGAPGSVDFTATAHFTVAEADSVRTTNVPHVEPITLTLYDAKKKPTPMPVSWSGETTQVAMLTLPVELPDGDYTLHADYTSALGKGSIDLALPLYTPARVHVITDRPLYEPGNSVKFRAVVLRARDLAPLDGRPGKWVVTDPEGNTLLEENAAATDWGVVAGSFPLDRGAQVGEWHVSWSSAAATDVVAFEVKPFTLPRFRVDATASKSFYGPGDTPAIKGNVIYASGAPVADAQVDIRWDYAGDWPMPTDWIDKVLPKHAISAATGRFDLAMPKIPADLVGTATLQAHLSAIDAAGDRVESNVSVLLSQDGIAVSTVTELGDGLVQSQNNRLYLRVTTPDGRAITNAAIHVKRAWDPKDVGTDATLDEDGVAALQLDPGAPVNIVIPAMPYRPGKPPPLVTRGEPTELIESEGAPLADQVAMDRWLPALASCAPWFAGDGDAKVGIRVDASGGIRTVVGSSDRLGQCTVGVIRGQHLPPGKERLYAVAFTYTDPPLGSIGAEIVSTSETPTDLAELATEAARGARPCMPTAENSGGPMLEALRWHATEGSKIVELGEWMRDPASKETLPSDRVAQACLASHVGGRLQLAAPATADAIGLVRYTLTAPTIVGETRPQATTMLGYELAVSVDLEGKPSTKLRIKPGTQPDLRLRVSPVLAKVGETVTAELLRGPRYTQKLPEELELEHLHGKAKAAVDKDRHTATFTIEPHTEGWVEIRGGGVRALVYVRPEGELAVAMKPGQPSYKPGAKASLEITTTLGGKGGKAAVGLIGVDESLGQLVPLPGPDDMGRVRPQVTTTSPAFGILDGQALALGRIRGANAAAATVIRVATIPTPPELDAVIEAHQQSAFDPIAELTDHFYIVLAELHVGARAWETSAPAGEMMKPATMARLWTEALAAVAKRDPIQTQDAYGRTLTLSRLPRDLLELTDPRMVIVVGTRLPEDVENWAQWVDKEQP